MDINTKLSPWYNSVPNFPNISKPKIIGYFSVDGNRIYLPTAQNLRYLKLPTTNQIKLDLNKGYEYVIHKPESASDEKIDHLLKFVLENKNKFIFNPEHRKLNFDFICFRGLLRLIMCTPYEYQEDWCVLVTKYNGNLYLCQQETEQKQYRRLNETEKGKKFCSYGFKFEQYLLTEDPKKEPETDRPVNESEEFCCMFSTKLEGLRLVYGAEMDGVLSNHAYDFNSIDPNKLEFVELKVTAKCMSYKQTLNYIKYKTRNWWCQSFLVGIENLFVGFRDERGIVEEINKIEVKSLAKKSAGHWHSSVCMDFLVQFLKTVQNIMRNVDCPYTVYKFYWHPKSSRTITFTEHRDKSAFTILPDWYINEFQKKISNFTCKV